MSEPTWTRIEIGGTLTSKQAKKLLEAIAEEFYEYTGATTVNEIKKKDGNCWEGRVNYGEPDEVIAFCEKHNLTYSHHCEAGPEWDATDTFWMPGMEGKDITQTSEAGHVVPINTIRAPLQALFAYAEEGVQGLVRILPNLADQNFTKGVVEKLLKKKIEPLAFVRELKKEFHDCLKEDREIPPLVIKE